MKKVIKLTESDLTRIVKRVLKENVDQDTMDQLDNLEDDANNILGVIYDFCERAEMLWDIEIPEEDSVEADELASKISHIDSLCDKFREILRYYYYE